MGQSADREERKKRMGGRWGFLAAGLLKGTVTGGLAAWLFYRSVYGLSVVPFFLGVSLFRERKKTLQRQKEQEQQMFAEWLGFLREALQVGYSLEQAVGEARKGMLTSYKEEEPFLCLVTRVQRKIQLGMPAEEAFAGLAGECVCEEMADFSEVLFIAKRTGGTVQQVISNTERMIREKQETVRHIRAVLGSREYEVRLMKGMPFAMLLYLQIFLPEFLSPLYQNAAGAGLMSVFLVIYGGLCLAVDKITAVSF